MHVFYTQNYKRQKFRISGSLGRGEISLTERETAVSRTKKKVLKSTAKEELLGF